MLPTWLSSQTYQLVTVRWILTYSAWDDTGIWDDNDVWND
jgi:hypothetical protein